MLMIPCRKSTAFSQYTQMFHAFCTNFLSLSCFRQRLPRRSNTSADMLCCSLTPQRGDTLVTAGRRPADTANLPTNSVPGGVAHHSSVSQHPLVRLDAKLPQQSLVLIFKAHCLMMSLLVGDIVLHHLLVSLTVG